MTWQEPLVGCIVASAIVFLVRKVLGLGRRPPGAASFIPLTNLRRRPPSSGCHD